MKKTLKKTISIFLVLAALSFLNPAQAVQLTITCPSRTQNILAPTRDFYVMGLISRDKTPSDEPLDIRIDLFRLDGGRRRVRTVWSRTGASGLTESAAISSDFAANSASVNNYSKTPAWKWIAPDMVYDPAGKNSFGDPRKKAVVYDKYDYNAWTGKYKNGDHYAAMVQGGITKGFMSNYTYLYGKENDLKKGDYQLIVTAFSRTKGDVASADMKLRFDYTPRKVLARFSPNEHMENVMKFAKTKDCYILLDKFPGYWDTFEITRRWRPNDSVEYNGGIIDTILYNINSTCATQTVEIAYLANRGEVRSKRVRYYRYDTGEPYIAYGAGGIKGSIVQMGNSPFEVTRAEFRAPDTKTSDNSLSKGDRPLRADFMPKYGIRGRQSEKLSLYGVVLPANCRAERRPDETYVMDNFAARIRYEVIGGGKSIKRTEKSVGLSRDGGKPSIYEYRHDFDLSELDAGAYKFKMTVLDKNGIELHPSETIEVDIVK